MEGSIPKGQESIMTTKQAVNRINEAYWLIERACESDTNWERYLDLHKDEERRHRRICPDHVQWGLTSAQAVRLFAVKELYEIVTGEQFRPTCEDYFRVRGSIYAAWAIWQINGEKIAKAVSKEEAKAWLNEIDYAKLNKDPREAVAA